MGRECRVNLTLKLIDYFDIESEWIDVMDGYLDVFEVAC